MIKIHRYTIFINQKTTNKETQEKVNYIINSLVKCRVPRQTVKICDVGDSVEFQEVLEKQANGRPYPIVFLWGEYYGVYDDVKNGMKDGSLQLAVLNDPNKLHQGKRYGLIRPKSELEHAEIYDDYTRVDIKKDIFKDSDIIDEYINKNLKDQLVEMKGVDQHIELKESNWITASEWVLRVISGLLFIPLIKKAFVSKTVEKEDGDVEFKVVRTNWYWKHQDRIIRFGKDKFYRFNGDVLREEFEYSDVKEVLVNDTAIVIHFSTNSHSQFLECEETQQFIHTLQMHCPSVEVKDINKEEVK